MKTTANGCQWDDLVGFERSVVDEAPERAVGVAGERQRRGSRGRARRGGGSSRGSRGACCSPGDAPAEEAEEVLVDEVEPEEAVAVHAAGVAEAGEDVPGGGDGEEEERPVKGRRRRQWRYRR